MAEISHRKILRHHAQTSGRKRQGGFAYPIR